MHGPDHGVTSAIRPPSRSRSVAPAAAIADRHLGGANRLASHAAETSAGATSSPQAAPTA
jgi:hypothetical protein